MMTNVFLSEKKHRLCRMEVLFLVALPVCYLILLSPLLFTRTRMFAHDTIWYYGVMRYFYNAMLNGFFPYWNPYDYAGQPFYYNLGIARLFELPSLLVVLANMHGKGSLLSMYHWDFIIRIIISSLGVYFCVRETTRYTISGIIVFAAFLFSSYGLSSMRQCGLMTSFMWAPWALMFLVRLCRKFNIYNIIGFSLFTGWSITSYQAGYTLTFLQVFILAGVFVYPKKVFKVLRDKKNALYLFVLIAVVTMLSMHLISVFWEKDRSVPILRKDGGAENISYTVVRSGQNSKPTDLLSLIVPARAVLPELFKSKEYPMSEGYLYLGWIPFIFSIAGIIFSRDKFKKIFLISLAMIFFLMMGYHFRFGFSGMVFFPFLIFARHMQLFQPFFLLILVYFTGQGADLLLDRVNVEKG
jgi:hypothetical protein